MIPALVHKISSDLGVQPPTVTIFDGASVGCLDVHLLKLSRVDQQESILVHQKEIDSLAGDIRCEYLENKIRTALVRLSPDIWNNH